MRKEKIFFLKSSLWAKEHIPSPSRPHCFNLRALHGVSHIKQRKLQTLSLGKTPFTEIFRLWPALGPCCRKLQPTLLCHACLFVHPGWMDTSLSNHLGKKKNEKRSNHLVILKCYWMLPFLASFHFMFCYLWAKAWLAYFSYAAKLSLESLLLWEGNSYLLRICQTLYSIVLIIMKITTNNSIW